MGKRHKTDWNAKFLSDARRLADAKAATPLDEGERRNLAMFNGEIFIIRDDGYHWINDRRWQEGVRHPVTSGPIELWEVRSAVDVFVMALGE